MSIKDKHLQKRNDANTTKAQRPRKDKNFRAKDSQNQGKKKPEINLSTGQHKQNSQKMDSTEIASKDADAHKEWTSNSQKCNNQEDENTNKSRRRLNGSKQLQQIQQKDITNKTGKAITSKERGRTKIVKDYSDVTGKKGNKAKSNDHTN